MIKQDHLIKGWGDYNDIITPQGKSPPCQTWWS